MRLGRLWSGVKPASQEAELTAFQALCVLRDHPLRALVEARCPDGRSCGKLELFLLAEDESTKLSFPT